MIADGHFDLPTGLSQKKWELNPRSVDPKYNVLYTHAPNNHFYR